MCSMLVQRCSPAVTHRHLLHPQAAILVLPAAVCPLLHHWLSVMSWQQEGASSWADSSAKCEPAGSKRPSMSSAPMLPISVCQCWCEQPTPTLSSHVIKCLSSCCDEKKTWPANMMRWHSRLCLQASTYSLARSLVHEGPIHQALTACRTTCTPTGTVQAITNHQAPYLC